MSNDYITSFYENSSSIEDNREKLIDHRVSIQKKAFTKWINSHLNKAGHNIDNLFVDLQDGMNLAYLIELLTNTTLKKSPGHTRFHALQNITGCLEYLNEYGVKLVNIRTEDIHEGNAKLTLGLIWTLIIHFELSLIKAKVKNSIPCLTENDGEQGVNNNNSDSQNNKENFVSNNIDRESVTIRGALLAWAKDSASNNGKIIVSNFTSSWKDGKAFCSIISKYASDVLPSNLWDHDNITAKERLKLAFDTATNFFDVPNILDPEDVDCENPDDKSIMTYLSLLCSNLSLLEVNNSPSKDDKVKSFMNEQMENFSSMVSSFKNKPTTFKIDVLKDELKEHESLICDMEEKKKEFDRNLNIYTDGDISVECKKLVEDTIKHIDKSIELAYTRLYNLQETFEISDILNENVTNIQKWLDEFFISSKSIKNKISNASEEELLRIEVEYLDEYCENLNSKNETFSHIIERLNKFLEGNTNEEITSEISSIKNNLNKNIDEAWSTLKEIADLIYRQKTEKLEESFIILDSSINDDRRIFNDKVAKMEFDISEFESIINELNPVNNISLDQMELELSEMNDVVVKIDEKTFLMDELRKHVEELKENNLDSLGENEEKLRSLEKRWKTITEFFKGRSTDLDSALIDHGKILQVIDETINWIDTIKKSIEEENIGNGDAKMIDLEICRLNVIGDDIINHEKSIAAIKNSLSEKESLSNSVLEKMSKMNRKYDALKKIWQNKLKDLEIKREEAMVTAATLDEIKNALLQQEKKLMLSQPLPALKENLIQEKEKFDSLYKEFKYFKEKTLGMGHCDINNDCKMWHKNNISLILSQFSDLENLYEEKKCKLEGALEVSEKIESGFKSILEFLKYAEKFIANVNIQSRSLETLTNELQRFEDFNVEYKNQTLLFKDMKQTIDDVRSRCDKRDSTTLKNNLSKICQHILKLETNKQEKYDILKTKQNDVSTFFTNINEELNWMSEISSKICEISKVTSPIQDIQSTLDKWHHIRNETVQRAQVSRTLLKKGTELEGEACLNEKFEYRNCMNKLVNERESLNDKTLSGCQFIQNLCNEKEMLNERIKKYTRWCENRCKSIKDELNENKFDGDLIAVEKLEKDYQIIMSDFKIQEPFIEDELINLKNNNSLSELNDNWNKLKKLIDEKKDALKNAKDKALDLNIKYNDLHNFLSNVLINVSLSPVLTKERVIERIEEAKASASLIKEKKKDFEKIKCTIEDTIETASHDGKCNLEKMLRELTYKWNDTIIKSDAESSIYEADLKNFEILSHLIDEGRKRIEEYRDELKKLDPPEHISSLDVHDFVLQQYLLIKSDIETYTVVIDGLDEKINELSYKSIGKEYLMKEKNILNKEWISLKQESIEFGERLVVSKDVIIETNELANFSFSEWRDRYMKWHDLGKLRINDIFRNFDDKGTGYLPKENIISPFLLSSFPTTKKEMEKVANFFDEGNNKISVKKFLQALKVPSEKNESNKVEEMMIIENEIERQFGQCKCCEKYNFKKICTTDSGVTYSFGSNSTVKRLVRILQYSIMVRVGGGWESLETFLQSHDPCRMVKKTNSEIYSSLRSNASNAATKMENFTQKRHNSYGLNSVSTGTKSSDTTPRRTPSRQNSKIPIFTKLTNQS
uniref:Calponin-homology (CH) domain-containing protein n=1 Tax=Parastrongyloides trichosuri TaxID=131310 RepID=A0A0N4ZNW0_PARTI